MHLEKNILKGKFGKGRELKKEAEEELEEVKGKKKGKAMAKALEKKKDGKKHEHEEKDGECKHCGMEMEKEEKEVREKE